MRKVRRKSFSDSKSLDKTITPEQGVRVRRKSDPLRSTIRRSSPAGAGRTTVPLKLYDTVACKLEDIRDAEARSRVETDELDLMKDYFDRISNVVEESCARGTQKCVRARERLRACLHTEATMCATDAVRISTTQRDLKVAYDQLCSEVGVIRDSCTIAGPLFDEASEPEARAAADKVMVAYASNYLPREPPIVNGYQMTGPPTVDSLNKILRESLLVSKGRDAHADAVRSSPLPAARTRPQGRRPLGFVRPDECTLPRAHFSLACTVYRLTRRPRLPRSIPPPPSLPSLSAAPPYSYCRMSRSLRVATS